MNYAAIKSSDIANGPVCGWAHRCLVIFRLPL